MTRNFFFNVNPMTPNWMEINPQGDVVHINWEEAEFWAESFKKGLQNHGTLAAFVAVAIREHTLKVKYPGVIKADE